MLRAGQGGFWSHGVSLSELRQHLTVVDSFDISTQAPTNSSNQSLLFPGIKSRPCAALCLEFQLLLEEVSQARNMTPQFEQAQCKAEEQQRVFGINPNFYVSYESDLALLTTKMKFELAIQVSTDPVTAAAGPGILPALLPLTAARRISQRRLRQVQLSTQVAENWYCNPCT